ncbi:type II toxin-antitoxin system PemK/MazF family toxin [Argonema galeatum]|uniref:type II toxin-antitoxin system PemK/MazF family toxin n=1 Tax=Argonema galeatum TaxID=2942762 RepID=UPI00201276CB|nr:type II toxin-antitoxin system PemK/MazF family toxin [Argonema galeatum]MCL1463405.1 type II toxin-antitoxin system PemK/MazF family toxin [Argonema galeatum A003/A1]
MTITVKRGEVWIADLNPTQGSEQAGIRPVIIFQNDIISQFTTTVLAIPLTTNLRRASLPTCLLILSGEAGLNRDSVALCYQMRVLDKTRLQRKLGELNPDTTTSLEEIMLLTLGY